LGVATCPGEGVQPSAELPAEAVALECARIECGFVLVGALVEFEDRRGCGNGNGVRPGRDGFTVVFDGRFDALDVTSMRPLEAVSTVVRFMPFSTVCGLVASGTVTVVVVPRMSCPAPSSAPSTVV